MTRDQPVLKNTHQGEHVHPGMKAESAAVFERTIPENPKVIGTTKALVETMEGSVVSGRRCPRDSRKPWSASLTRVFSSGGGNLNPRPSGYEPDE
jgi:hypothetical protein